MYGNILFHWGINAALQLVCPSFRKLFPQEQHLEVSGHKALPVILIPMEALSPYKQDAPWHSVVPETLFKIL